MRSIAMLIAAFGLAGASAAVAPAAQTAPGGQPQPSVTVTDCHPSADVQQRYASFSGQMDALPGTSRMAMRFTLLERLRASGHFRAVPLRDLRSWRRSRPGASGYIYTQRVTALRDGGWYRMRVQFRWYDASGAVLKTAYVRSAGCHQPLVLPNLTISSIVSTPAPAGGRVYSITVANDGKGDARNVAVALRVDGAVVGVSTLDLIPGQESAVAQITGPDCSVGARAVVDPYRQIRETDDSDNALAVPCTGGAP